VPWSFAVSLPIVIVPPSPDEDSLGVGVAVVVGGADVVGDAVVGEGLPEEPADEPPQAAVTMAMASAAASAAGLHGIRVVDRVIEATPVRFGRRPFPPATEWMCR
jgi:hypothetical protein